MGARHDIVEPLLRVAPEKPWDRPIFLHSGYRSGSTWFWNRFRETEGVLAFFEPFNVRLAALTEERLALGIHENWPSGHPALSRPYFEEYRPLLKPEGGVVLFDPRFGVESHYRDEDDPELAAYLASLIAEGTRRGLLPVLGFCGSLGRLPWFRRLGAGVDLVTWRNPRDQWTSCHRQWLKHGNFGFEVHYLLLAFIAGLRPDLAPFLDGLGPIPSPDAIRPDMPLFTEPEGVGRRFRVFLRMFTLDMLIALQHAELVVDLDLMAENPGYRAVITAELGRLSGLSGLSFEDCDLPRHAFDPDADYQGLIRAELSFLDRLAAGETARQFERSLPFLTARLAAFL